MSKNIIHTKWIITITSAKIVYNMLKNGTKYKDMGQDYYETRYIQRSIDNLKRRAKQFGYKLTLTEEKQLVMDNG